jgi:hypothetical protein
LGRVRRGRGPAALRSGAERGPPSGAGALAGRRSLTRTANDTSTVAPKIVKFRNPENSNLAVVIVRSGVKFSMRGKGGGEGEGSKP